MHSLCGREIVLVRGLEKQVVGDLPVAQQAGLTRQTLGGRHQARAPIGTPGSTTLTKSASERTSKTYSRSQLEIAVSVMSMAASGSTTSGHARAVGTGVWR